MHQRNSIYRMGSEFLAFCRGRSIVKKKLQAKACLLLVFAWATSPAFADILSGRVVAVADGDTITVLDSSNRQHKVRLSGIDAPEKAQPFGNKSKQHLAQLIYDKAVIVEWTKRDRYGRIVGKVLVISPELCPSTRPDCQSLIDTGLAQITGGLAWHYKKYEGEQTVEDRQLYSDAEAKARAQRTGLWEDSNPAPPWEWRHRRQN